MTVTRSPYREVSSSVMRYDKGPVTADDEVVAATIRTPGERRHAAIIMADPAIGPLTPFCGPETLPPDSVVGKGDLMAVVESVRGPVNLGSLGQTLMHEHVFVLSTEHVQNYGSSWWDEEARVADAIAKLNALYAKGIHTIVDPTVKA